MNEPTLDTALEEARRLRDEGAQAAMDGGHAWAVMAGREALRDLAASGREFSSDDLRDRVGSPLGCNPQVIGSLILAASRRGEIVATGFVISRRPEAHARPIRTWKGAT